MAYFPFRYLEGFLRHVAADPSINVMTYDDLPFGGDFDHENTYPYEFSKWYSQADPTKKHLLIQYDVDSAPHITAAALRVHEATGVPVNVMLFNAPAKQSQRSYHHALWQLVVRLRKTGQVCLGYHCNAYERAGFDLDEMAALISEDVGELSLGYEGDVRYISPHGGLRDANGKSNAHVLKIPEKLRNKIRWVHNRYTIRLQGQYSDGGIAKKVYDADRDLRAFVFDRMQPGRRYRILIHPQYYSDTYQLCEPLKEFDWYREIFDKAGDVW